MKQTTNIHKVFSKYFKGSDVLAYALSSTLSDGGICLDLDEYPKQFTKDVVAEEINPFWKGEDDYKSALQDHL
jgi:hypothetical protein